MSESKEKNDLLCEPRLLDCETGVSTDEVKSGKACFKHPYFLRGNLNGA